MNWSLLPPVCLAIGLALGLTVGVPKGKPKDIVSKSGKWALQISVVLLGFGIPVGDVWRTGREGFVLALATIAGTFALAALLKRLLGTPAKLAALVAAGTAICGGSAIAALAPVIAAEPDEMAASLATVFLLNAIALFLFPYLGHAAGMSVPMFGEWAALAIHDTSSVVGAALAFDPAALPIAATVKLSRALWIAPVCIAAAFAMRRSSSAPAAAKTPWLPWFLPAFLAASLVRSFVPAPALYDVLAAAAKVGLAFSLLCIGLGVNRQVLAKAGGRAALLGVSLWAAVSVSTFLWLTRVAPH